MGLVELQRSQMKSCLSKIL